MCPAACRSISRITKRIDDYNIKSTGKQETFTYNLDKQRLEQDTPKVVEQNDLEVSGLSEIQLDDEYVTDLKQSGDDRDLEGIGSLEEVVTEEDLTETLTTEVKVESKPKLEKHPSVPRSDQARSCGQRQGPAGSGRGSKHQSWQQQRLQAGLLIPTTAWMLSGQVSLIKP